MSSPANSANSVGAVPSIVSNVSSESDDSKPASLSFRQQDNDPTKLAEGLIKAAINTKLTPDAVTSPLEALALACVAENKAQQLPEFTDNDVLCGRGGLTNNARGNIFFRHLVRMKQDEYLAATKREKAGVAHEIVQAIKCLNPPGRFLKKDASGKWVEIGDRKAREKTSQALREGAPEKRFNMNKASTPSPTAPSQPPHVIGAAQGTSPQGTPTFQGQPFVPPDPWAFPSNRARVVSDDSVGIQGSLMQQAAAAAGTKRKASCSLQETQEASSKRGGPRLKLFKSRLMG